MILRNKAARWMLFFVFAAITVVLVTGAVLSMRRQARVEDCQNSLKMIGLGLLNYSVTDNASWPAPRNLVQS